MIFGFLGHAKRLWLSFCICVLTHISLASALPPGTVIYGVVPALFGAKPLQAVTGRLGELRAQGVDVLWLSPINTTDDASVISYSITDYYGIRDDFGTAEDLRKLVASAQQQGLKVILDFVPNHTSARHPFFLDMKAKAEKSAYFDFFEHGLDGSHKHYFDWAHLPNLNYSNPAVTSMMSDAFKYWVREFNVDGFRVDVAWGVRQRNERFWPSLTRELKALNPNLIMLAEASAKDSYFCEEKNGFDLTYDWTEELGQWAWQDIFSNPLVAGAKLSAALSASTGCPGAKTLRFLNNNDTGERFITRHGLMLTRVAAVLQHTIPGVPLVYTGDEIGAEYLPYEDPQPLAWQDRYSLRTFYRRLADLRKTTPALLEGDMTIVPQKNEAVLAFIRHAQGKQKLLVILNFGPTATVSLAKKALGSIFPANHKDLLTGRNLALKQKRLSLNFQVEATSALTLELI